jgi:hypothetical protein
LIFLDHNQVGNDAMVGTCPHADERSVVSVMSRNLSIAEQLGNSYAPRRHHEQAVRVVSSLPQPDAATRLPFSAVVGTEYLVTTRSRDTSVSSDVSLIDGELSCPF